MNLELKDMTLDEIIDQLKKIKDMLPSVKDWKVRIGWATGNKSCVGKILAISKDDDQGTVYLFPVPENIGNINAMFKLMTSMVCPKRADGQDCNDCPDIMTCGHVEAIEKNLRELNQRHSTSTKRE